MNNAEIIAKLGSARDKAELLAACFCVQDFDANAVLDGLCDIATEIADTITRAISDLDEQKDASE